MTVKKTPIRKTPVKRKNAIIKQPIKVSKTNPNAKFTKKSELEREEIKCLISISLRKSNSVATIIQEIKERGFSISNQTAYTYIKDIRNEWREAMSANYEAHVASQYAKLDLMEERLWLMLDRSMNDKIKLTEESETPENADEQKENAKPTKTQKKEITSSHGDVEIMKMIERIWVRRNEILGITSSTVSIQNNIQNNIKQNTTVEVTKVEFQPVSDKFFGNFVIEVDGRGV